VAEADRLLAAGRPFVAHEVLETAWKAAPVEEREMWRGLAQIAVGLTHAQRGNATGAARLLRRGAARLAGQAGASAYGVAVEDVVRTARELAHAADAGRLPADSDAGLRLRHSPGGNW
jgi:predicted metal-dependent hydrolase